MSAKTDEILESLKTLSLLEASELVKQIEEAFGVSAAASAGVVMAALVLLVAVAMLPKKTEFDVIRKLRRLRQDQGPQGLREATGLGLGDAEALVS